jgi:large subunit ribosomal protein L22
VPGPKLNEAPVRRPSGLRPAPGTAGARALARYVRVSPYKVREVLDLIRGHDIQRAREILRLTQRDAAQVVAKVLQSAVANAEHNGHIPEDELYVSSCYADEGPTLKRWRPRARGRATRIRKRTCHITVIVSRLPEAELAGRRAEQAARRARRAGERRRRGGEAAPATAPPEPVATGDESPGTPAPEPTPGPEATEAAATAVVAEGVADAGEATTAGPEAEQAGEGGTAGGDDAGGTSGADAGSGGGEE